MYASEPAPSLPIGLPDLQLLARSESPALADAILAFLDQDDPTPKSIPTGALTLQATGETTMILGAPVWLGQALMVPGFVLLALAGLFIGTQSDAAGADHSSRVSAWSGGLVLELLCAVPILCAVPGLFHELANSRLLHSATPGAVAVPLGITELLPAVAILPFMLYQLGGFGTLHYVVPRAVNWVINLGILGLILGSTAANRMGAFAVEKALVATLVISMALVVFYGVMKLRQMQAAYDDNLPLKPHKDDK